MTLSPCRSDFQHNAGGGEFQAPAFLKMWHVVLLLVLQSCELVQAEPIGLFYFSELSEHREQDGDDSQDPEWTVSN